MIVNGHYVFDVNWDRRIIPNTGPPLVLANQTMKRPWNVRVFR